jgi:hypothetical protein
MNTRRGHDEEPERPEGERSSSSACSRRDRLLQGARAVMMRARVSCALRTETLFGRLHR